MIWVGLLLLVALLVATSDKPEGAWVWVTLAGIVWALRSWRRRRAYPEARSKAHGATPEQLKAARQEERRLLAPEPKLLSDGSMGEQTYWERVMGEAGLPGTTLLRVEATYAGWEYRVELRSGNTLEQARSARGALESAFDRRPGAITVEQDAERARVVVLKIKERAPDTAPALWPGAPRDASIIKPAMIGTYVEGGPLLVPLRDEVLLIAGVRGSGKSGVVNALVGYLAACSDAVLWGIDLKRGVELKPWRSVLQKLATTLSETEALLSGAVVLMEQRLEQMGGSERFWPVSPERPALVVVIDEQSLVKQSADAIGALEDLAKLGRAAGVTLIIATQYPTKDEIGSAVLVEQVTVAIGLKVRSPLSDRVVFGEDAKVNGWKPHAITSGPGHLYLRAEGVEDRPNLARAFYVTDAKVRETVERYRGMRPVLGTARPAAVPHSAPLAGSVPQDHTQTDEPDGSGGGEPAPHEALRRLLQSPDGISDAALAERLEMSLAWVKKWRGNYGAVQVERGLWRLP